MKKYGRTGWFGESHRHYLASKGVKTASKHDWNYRAKKLSDDSLNENEKMLRKMSVEELNEEAGRMMESRERGEDQFSDELFEIDAELKRRGQENKYMAHKDEKLALLTQEDIDTMTAFPFPNLSEEKELPEGWKETETFFVSKLPDGWDKEGPALEPGEFRKKLKPGKAYAITDEGQFQVYVTEFEKDDTYPLYKKGKSGKYDVPTGEVEDKYGNVQNGDE